MFAHGPGRPPQTLRRSVAPLYLWFFYVYLFLLEQNYLIFFTLPTISLTSGLFLLVCILIISLIMIFLWVILLGPINSDVKSYIEDSTTLAVVTVFLLFMVLIILEAIVLLL